MTAKQDSPDSWEKAQKILVILAHPDDPEFFCGATLARWAQAGHELHYRLLTCGDKGARDPALSTQQICHIRLNEQRAAAAIIGVSSLEFLNYPDGHLTPSLGLRRNIVQFIRQLKPDILVTCDPTNLFPSTTYGINHPDHRYAGQVVLDAVFPSAGNPHYFPEQLKEGLEPHTPREVWISLAEQPNITLDVTTTWPIKIRALQEHKSQIGDMEKFLERMKKRRAEGSTEDKPRYEEKFRRIILG